MTTCGACGPLGTRFDNLRKIADMVVSGHRMLSTEYREIAKEMTDPEDAKTINSLADYHAESANVAENNIPTFTEETTNDKPADPDVG